MENIRETIDKIRTYCFKTLDLTTSLRKELGLNPKGDFKPLANMTDKELLCALGEDHDCGTHLGDGCEVCFEALQRGLINGK